MAYCRRHCASQCVHERIFEFIVNSNSCLQIKKAWHCHALVLAGQGRAGPHRQWDNKVRLQPSALQNNGVLLAPLRVTVCPWDNFWIHIEFKHLSSDQRSLAMPCFDAGRAGQAGPHRQWDNKVRLQPSALQTNDALPALLRVTVYPWESFWIHYEFKNCPIDNGTTK